MFAVGLNLWLNFRLRLWETKTLRFLNVIWWVWIDAEVLGVLDWDYRIVEVESVDVGRQRVNQRRISVQKCLKKRLVFKSVPSTWLFVTFPHLVAIDPSRSLILNLFQSVLLKSNPSMLVDKEWINVEYRFKIVWRRFH